MSKRARKHVKVRELLAAALADLLPQEMRDELRAAKVPAKKVIKLFTPDHNILHAHGGSDLWWNLTMRIRGPELKAKDANDTKIAAKVKRLRGETCAGPKQKIRSKGFDKSKTRKFSGEVVDRAKFKPLEDAIGKGPLADEAIAALSGTH